MFDGPVTLRSFFLARLATFRGKLGFLVEASRISEGHNTTSGLVSNERIKLSPLSKMVLGSWKDEFYFARIRFIGGWFFRLILSYLYSQECGFEVERE